MGTMLRRFVRNAPLAAAVIARSASDEAIHSYFALPLRGEMDCFAPLAMTGSSECPNHPGRTHPMASIQKDIAIDATPADVWEAVRDFGALHTRLVPGFVIDTKIDGDARIVTFANGNVAREALVDCDDERRRLVY